jgi:hypothetical protein
MKHRLRVGAQPREISGRQAKNRCNFATRRAIQSWRRVVATLQAVKVGQLNMGRPSANWPNG